MGDASAYTLPPEGDNLRRSDATSSHFQPKNGYEGSAGREHFASSPLATHGGSTSTNIPGARSRLRRACTAFNRERSAQIDCCPVQCRSAFDDAGKGLQANPGGLDRTC